MYSCKKKKKTLSLKITTESASKSQRLRRPCQILWPRFCLRFRPWVFTPRRSVSCGVKLEHATLRWSTTQTENTLMARCAHCKRSMNVIERRKRQRSLTIRRRLTAFRSFSRFDFMSSFDTHQLASGIDERCSNSLGSECSFRKGSRHSQNFESNSCIGNKRVVPQRYWDRLYEKAYLAIDKNSSYDDFFDTGNAYT